MLTYIKIEEKYKNGIQDKNKRKRQTKTKL